MLSSVWTRARKSAWLVLALVVFILVERGLVSLRHSGPETAPAVSPATLLTCTDWVDGKPFGVDSVFLSPRDRVYAVSTGGSGNASHIWYHNGDRVAFYACNNLTPCRTSMAPESLSVGEWSVDLIDGSHLLATRQFTMTALR